MEEKKELLLTAHSYLERLIIGIDNLLKDLESRSQEALKGISDLSEGISWLVTALNGTKEMHGIGIDPMKNNMNDVLEAVENRDYLLMSDIVEYEIRPMLCDYYDVLDPILFAEKQ